MSDPVLESMADVLHCHQRVREIAENAEEVWLDKLADEAEAEAEAEGTAGSILLEGMATLLRPDQD